MYRPQCYDERGNPIDYDDDDVVPSGGRVTVPTMFMDNLPPEQVLPSRRGLVSDDDRELADARERAQQAYDARSRRYADAYKHKPICTSGTNSSSDPRQGDQDDDPRTITLDDALARREDAIAQRKIALSNRWRNP